ncbi:tetrahydrocannabinolic acid synthase-like [Benincasa hispida]|uniref:tetrahydrocannabinolic acid synthase-like n=1 Tax=Benincasa hispida TaxID=102211 RepID=UPI0019007987|nr:tetrahydrocannabinolic acid synthase-like [Benincasa hispida]
MKSFLLTPFALTFIVLSISPSWVVFSTKKHENFVQCLLNNSLSTYPISNLIYTPINSSYSSILNFSIQNLRFSSKETPKPLAIITPSHVSHIQAAIICSKSHALQIRTRSGGHDFEGLSYISDVPFVVVDLINLKSIAIDVENETAWVQSGATLGELYYRIAEKSRTLAFPAGSCPTVGVGGHLSGGGFGWLMRKYGLAADNVIDASFIDANGKVYDRESMGEDLFWAIRGGGGGSFGIVVAWKVKLVRVPATVTICGINRNLEEEDTIKLIHRWQYVTNKLDENLLLGISLIGGNSTQEGGKTNPMALFSSFFLGKVNELVTILNTNFSELGLAKEDCSEMSWIKSVLIMAGFPKQEALEVLLNRAPPSGLSTKIKSDYVKEPISKASFKTMFKRLKAEDIEVAQIMFIPYGGRMSEISESLTPFPHRAGNIYKLGYYVKWKEQSIDAEKRHLNWVRVIYDYMTPFVSKSPRAAYNNYRDLDIGTNNKCGKTSYNRARVWGLKYFGKNFDRLVHVKTKIDPTNFFRNEQSIPTLTDIKYSTI